MSNYYERWHYFAELAARQETASLAALGLKISVGSAN